MDAWRYRDHPFVAVQGSEEEVREVVELLDKEMGIEVESIEMPSDMPRLFKWGFFCRCGRELIYPEGVTGDQPLECPEHGLKYGMDYEG